MAINSIAARLAFQKILEAIETEDSSEIFEVLQSTPKKPVDLERFRKEDPDTGPGRRRAPRYSLKLVVLLCGPHHSFRTQSINVSMSGILLSDVIPPYLLKDPFDIVLFEENSQDQKSYIKFRGCAVGGIFTPRLQFVSASEGSQEKLFKIVEEMTALVG